MQRIALIVRRSTAILAAGMVFQATGCQLNTSQIATELSVSILNNLIASFVFGAFNLIP